MSLNVKTNKILIKTSKTDQTYKNKHKTYKHKKVISKPIFD